MPYFPRPRIITNNQQLGFKILPKDGLRKANGIYFELNRDGSETVLWHRELLVCPQEAMLAHPYVITFDTFGRVTQPHAVVVYGPAGQVTVDLALSDLLSKQEIQHISDVGIGQDGLDVEPSDLFLWRQGAEIHVVEDPVCELRIHFPWGKVIGANLETGKVLKYWPPNPSGKYGLYSEKRLSLLTRE